jgi:hypothetical protein
MDMLPEDVLRVWMMPCFSTREACELRLVNKVIKNAVTAHPWADRETVVKGSLAAWRACFPHARAANMNHYDVCEAPNPAGLRVAPIPTEHYHHLSGLSYLSARGHPSFTDAALLHLGGSVQHLDISACMALSGSNMERVAGATKVVMLYCREEAYIAALARGVKAVWAVARNCGVNQWQNQSRGANGRYYCSPACYPLDERSEM